MKSHKINFFVVTSLTLILVSSIFCSVNAASKAYHGTTMNFNNSITDGSIGWNGGVSITTSPSSSFDYLGASVWTTYQICDGTIDYNTFLQYNSYDYSWMIQNQVRSWSDGIARAKQPCDGVTEGFNYTNYYWRDNPYSADNGETSAQKVLSSVW